MRLDEIAKDVKRHDKTLYGNGRPGMKHDVTVIGVKFWIIIILLLGNSGMFIKLLLEK
jgi:hypothetical protein